MEIHGIIDKDDLKVGTVVVLDKYRGEGKIVKVYQDKEEYFILFYVMEERYKQLKIE